MSDILKSLLNSYLSTITAQMVAGQTLSYVQAVYLLHPNDTQFLDWSTPAPFILAYVNDFQPIPDSMPLRSDQKNYPITLSYFVEFADENLGLIGDADYAWKGTIDAMDDLYNLFNRQNFSTSLQCITIGISFQRLGIEPLNHYHQAHLSLQHLWIDRRADL